MVHSVPWASGVAFPRSLGDHQHWTVLSQSLWLPSTSISNPIRHRRFSHDPLSRPPGQMIPGFHAASGSLAATHDRMQRTRTVFGPPPNQPSASLPGGEEGEPWRQTARAPLTYCPSLGQDRDGREDHRVARVWLCSQQSIRRTAGAVDDPGHCQCPSPSSRPNQQPRSSRSTGQRSPVISCQQVAPPLSSLMRGAPQGAPTSQGHALVPSYRDIVDAGVKPN